LGEEAREMTVAELKDKLELNPLNDLYDKTIDGVFISDMVSDVMAGAKPGALWVTTQSHKNVVAAANLVDICAVVVTRGKPVPDETLEMATRAELTILSTDLETYEFVGKLHAAGV
jgi:serine kinase of HPr protein (carbohydrate metabolism regulator)